MYNVRDTLLIIPRRRARIRVENAKKSAPRKSGTLFSNREVESIATLVVIITRSLLSSSRAIPVYFARETCAKHVTGGREDVLRLREEALYHGRGLKNNLISVVERPWPTGCRGLVSSTTSISPSSSTSSLSTDVYSREKYF